MLKIDDIKKIYIEKDLGNNEFVSKFCDKFPDKIAWINNFHEVPSHYFEKKESIILANQKGAFLKKCPCTPGYLGCKYYVVELSVGCLYDCSYCYLQEYQNVFATTFYVNFDKLFDEFNELLSSNPNEFFRIGFGEYADSLFFDDLLDYTGKISTFLAKNYKNYLIEYKTKSDNILNLLKFQPTGKEVVGWTINTLKISREEEKNAATFEERLVAMKKCVSRGYFVALHFDPIIDYPSWQEGYKFVVNRIFDEIDPKKIIWISLGTLRFNAKLKPIIEHRHDNSKIVYAEMIKGADGKMRYIKDLRKEKYKAIVTFIKQRNPEAFIYFCMEDEEIWREILGFGVSSSDEIHDIFLQKIKSLD